MRCEEARRRLLTADPGELDRSRESPLSRHLGACPSCREAAETMLEMERGLDAVLADYGREGEPAPAKADPAPEEETPAADAGDNRSDRRTGPWRVLVPLAAAAAVALLLLPGGDERRPAPGPGAERRAATPEAGPDGFHVRASGAERLLVFQPSDPEITVVWFVDESERDSPETERE